VANGKIAISMPSLEMIVKLLTADFPLASELQALGIAFQGAMAVRSGPNKDKKMHWFHAFALTTLLAFGGGWFGFLLMGKPTSMISGGDVNVTCCVIAFLAVNYSPLDIGYKLLSWLPFKILITVFAQLFRSTGTIKFINTAFNEVSPSPHYPIPVVGPILYGTMLGNMGGLFVKGFDGYLKDGVPFPFQNGFVLGSFYHLFANDAKGFLGTTLRGAIKWVGNGILLLGLDDRTFAHVIMAGFMQVAGILMLPDFLGPSFSPIADPPVWIGRTLTSKIKTPNNQAPVVATKVASVNKRGRKSKIS
jgi:TRIC channel